MPASVPVSVPFPAPSRGARAELAALVEAGTDAATRSAIADLPSVPDARPAAVLILFGVLDRIPSSHEARDAAVSRDLDVLLLSRATTLRAHPGQVAFPGGRVDAADESPVETALREAVEETGLDPRGVEILGSLADVPLAFSRHLVTPVVGWWRHPSPVRAVDAAESADVFRAPVADLLAPENRGVTVLRRGGQEFRGPAFRLDSGAGTHVVWGFTAILLDGLFDRLGWTEPWDRARIIDLPQ